MQMMKILTSYITPSTHAHMYIHLLGLERVRIVEVALQSTSQISSCDSAV